MNSWKSKETEEAHRQGAIKGGSVKVAKGFAYMKLHNPKRFKEVSRKGGKTTSKEKK